MKHLFIIVALTFICFGCQQNSMSNNSKVITSDIDNFWTAYDSITATQDTIQQAAFLKTLFLDQGTVGLDNMISARNYTVEEYLYTINTYPKFWNYIRKNTHKAKELSADLELGITKLNSIYPELKPAKIYFTIGALRSNGTTMDSLVLIGTELAFANKSTPTDEFPEYLSHLRSYFDTEPGKNIVFLNTHEYIHTQQKTTIGNSLLAQTVLEGAAEFVAEKALQTTSPNPQIVFGKANNSKIKAAFAQEMFSPNVFNWIWNNADNEFGMRDLAYYVGYKICEDYYNTSTDKTIAIKTMIELDYNNEADLIAFVEQSNYFDHPLLDYKNAFDKSRPKVTSIDNISTNTMQVSKGLDTLTIHFSEAMDVNFRNFQLGPLGENHLIRITEFLGFSEDHKSINFKVQPLEANTTYQLIIGHGFRNTNGIPLIPYLIDIKTEVE